MNKIAAYFFDKKNQIKEIEWFRNALYVFLLYKVCVYALQFESLFSNERLIYHEIKFVNFIVSSVYVLNDHYSVSLGVVFVLLTAILSIIGLLKKSNYLTNVLLWLIVTNLTNFLYPTLTAGDYLLCNLLFFNCFFIPKESFNVALNDIKTAIHNTSLIAIKLQVCLAYFIAAYFKITDASWLEGYAIYQTFQIPEFSNSFLESLPYSFFFDLTYLTMIYQMSFSFLVWFRPFKIYLFSFGIMQHLLIAFGMGLFGFGIIMTICYILFLKYDN
jgi:hypothetical protein